MILFMSNGCMFLKGSVRMFFCFYKIRGSAINICQMKDTRFESSLSQLQESFLPFDLPLLFEVHSLSDEREKNMQ